MQPSNLTTKYSSRDLIKHDKTSRASCNINETILYEFLEITPNNYLRN